MIDISSEPLIRLADAARLAGPGRGNRPTHFTTILRWIVEGQKTPTGIVKLEAVRVGDRWMTSAAATQRFFEALTSHATKATASPQATRQHRAFRAKRRLETRQGGCN